METQMLQLMRKCPVFPMQTHEKKKKKLKTTLGADSKNLFSLPISSPPPPSPANLASPVEAKPHGLVMQVPQNLNVAPRHSLKDHFRFWHLSTLEITLALRLLRKALSLGLRYHSADRVIPHPLVPYEMGTEDHHAPAPRQDPRVFELEGAIFHIELLKIEFHEI